MNSSASGRTQVSDDLMRSWLDNQVQPRIIGDDATRPVAVACWTIGQDELARKETERQLRNIVDLAILLERDLGEHKIYRRGDINRPGIRGIALDRGAMDRNLNDSAAMELASFPSTINTMGSINRVEWYSAGPLPLGDLLDQTYLCEAVQSCLKIIQFRTGSKSLRGGLRKRITPRRMMTPCSSVLRVRRLSLSSSLSAYRLAMLSNIQTRPTEHISASCRRVVSLEDMQ